MRPIDSTSLMAVAEDVNEAHFYGRKIPKTQARAAIAWLTSQFRQNIPEKIRKAKTPNPRWASLPKTFVLTPEDVKAGPTTFTGEPLKGGSMRAIHSREAARALHILGGVLGKPVPEAEEHCRSVSDTIAELERSGKDLYCCGPCTASVWRLMNLGALDQAPRDLEQWLPVLQRHRDGKGQWRRFPFFFTLLSLVESDVPAADAELRYALPECEKKRKHLRPGQTHADRRIAVLDRVLERCA